ncbi:MAG: quinone-dependent dihydroorotate dehydrogenase [Aestuariivita sp.]|nr:quinone-dependent dihydroorotate dehydrogenase [Aestuariivita sp.]
MKRPATDLSGASCDGSAFSSSILWGKPVVKDILERAGLRLLHQFPPEIAHSLSLRGLRLLSRSFSEPITTPRLVTHLAGMRFPNPIGLAAGYDKNAEVLGALSRSDFGFIEVGAATPIAQSGNPRPRVFRLNEDQAIINRLGFNNDGMDAIAKKLQMRPKGSIVGLNIGANKNSKYPTDDYVRVLESCGQWVNFVTLNVSSPNTEGLRELQRGAPLRALLSTVLAASKRLPQPPRVFLKIAPDLTDEQFECVTQVVEDFPVDAIVATNSTVSRAGVSSTAQAEIGGLSGQPLFMRSTKVLARLSTLTSTPLVGVGGVASAEQAYAKILAGASAVQLYTALVFRGLSIVRDICWGLEELLERDGYSSVAEAVGTRRDEWLQ